MALDGAARTSTGIFLQVLATFLAALAYVLQKQAHTMALAGGAGAPPATSSPRWRAGLACMVLVAGIDAFSFSLLDQSTLGAFGAATLAWNIVLARLVLGEALTRTTMVAAALIAVGTVLAVSSSGSAATDFTLPLILELAEQPRVYAWVVVNALGIAAAARVLEQAAALPEGARSPHHDVLFAVLSPVTGGMCMGCALLPCCAPAVPLPPITCACPTHRPTHPHPPACARTRRFTGWGAKAVSTVLFGGEWEQFGRAPLYGFIVLVAGALALQVRYLNRGLENADAMRVVPVFQAAIVFSNSMGGIIFYGDLLGESAAHQAAFAFGALVSICGVAVLLCRGGEGGGEGGVHQVLREEGSGSGIGSGSGSGAAGGAAAQGGKLELAVPQSPHSPLLAAAMAPNGAGASPSGPPASGTGERRGYQPV